MLVQLSIRSLLHVERLDLDMRDGLTAITGETGAGKSVLLNAVGLLVGAPATRDLVQPGVSQAIVSASFELPNEHEAWLLSAGYDVTIEREEPLILKRCVTREGRSRASINGQAVPIRALREVGGALFEVFAPNAVSALLDVSMHRCHLDSFAKAEDLRGRVQEFYAQYREKSEQLQKLESEQVEVSARRDWLAFAIEDLRQLEPISGEASRLEEERTVLRAGAKLHQLLAETETALTATELETHVASAQKSALAVQDLLSGISDQMEEQAKLMVGAIERTIIELEEACHGARQLHQSLDHEPEYYAHVESRLFALRAAGRKHATDPDTLDIFLDECVAELDEIEASVDRIDTLKHETENAFSAYLLAAEELSSIRQKAASRLEAAVAKELKPLHLSKVNFAVEVTRLDQERFGSDGIDRVEFLVETLAGHGLNPLAKIASSGELARFSLALKCALSESKSARSLFFDEADQGVGGAVADAIGKRLRRLSKNRQVVAITHSPQVASCADQQWQVRKQTTESVTQSQVCVLDEQDRLEEIARMLSGASVTDEARAAASKLLEVA